MSGRRLLLHRPRLLGRIAGPAAPPVTCVVAGPGWGKTLLLRDVLAEIPGAVAARGGTVRASRAAGARPGNEVPHVGGVSPSGGTPRATCIVVDDAHRWLERPGGEDALAALLREVPSTRLVLAARRRLPLPTLQRLRARGAVQELTAADLAFTDDEARSLLGLLGAPPSDAALAQAAGWPAALALLAAGGQAAVADYVEAEFLSAASPGMRRFLLDTSVLAVLTPGRCARLAGADSRSLLVEVVRENLHWRGDPEAPELHPLVRQTLQAVLAGEPGRWRRQNREAAALAREEGRLADAAAFLLAAGDAGEAATALEALAPGLLEQDPGALASLLEGLPEALQARRPALLREVGAALLRGGQHLLAARWLQRAARAAGELGRPALLARCLYDLGLVRREQGRVLDAVAVYYHALHDRPSDDPRHEAAALRYLADCQALAGELGPAAGYYESSVRIFESAGDLPEAARTALTLALRCHLRQGDCEGALAALREARQAAERSGQEDLRLEVRAALATVHAHFGDVHGAALAAAGPAPEVPAAAAVRLALASARQALLSVPPEDMLGEEAPPWDPGPAPAPAGETASAPVPAGEIASAPAPLPPAGLEAARRLLERLGPGGELACELALAWSQWARRRAGAFPAPGERPAGVMGLDDALQAALSLGDPWLVARMRLEVAATILTDAVRATLSGRAGAERVRDLDRAGLELAQAAAALKRMGDGLTGALARLWGCVLDVLRWRHVAGAMPSPAEVSPPPGALLAALEPLAAGVAWAVRAARAGDGLPDPAAAGGHPSDVPPDVPPPGAILTATRLLATAPCAGDLESPGALVEAVAAQGPGGPAGVRALLRDLSRGDGPVARVAAPLFLRHVCAHPPPLFVRCLGPLAVFRGDEELPVAAWPRRSARGLLLLLLLRAGQPLLREELMDRLWPDQSPRNAANSLRVALHDLRRSLAAGLPAEPPYVVAAAGFVSLSRSLVRTDWWDLEEILRGVGTALPASTERAAHLCRQALRLYRGDLLAGDPYLEPASGPREATRERVLAALDRTARTLAGGGNRNGAIELLEGRLQLDPAGEDAARALIHLLALAGRRAEALRRFRQLEANLARDLGVAPEDATRRLAEMVRAGRVPPLAMS